MKKYIVPFVLLFAGFLPSVSAQESLQVNVLTAGTLSSQVLTPKSVTNLTVSGTLDARDLKFIRDELTALASVDLADVAISSYEGEGGTSTGSLRYAENVIPDQAFSRTEKIVSGADSWDELVGIATLESVVLPKSVTLIGMDCFRSCSKLTHVFFPKSLLEVGAGAFSRIPSLKEIDLSVCDQLLTLNGDAFYSCRLLSSVILPASVTTLGNYVFDTTGLTLFTVMANQPLDISDIKLFNDQKTPPANCTLYVPSAALAAYQAAPVWKDFAKIKAIGSDPIIKENEVKTLDSDISGDLILHYGGQVNCAKDVRVNGTVSLIRQFPEIEEGSQDQWYAISFPFDVETITVPGLTNPIHPCPDATGQGDFWLRTWNESTQAWEVAPKIKANTLYLIAVPGSPWYMGDAGWERAEILTGRDIVFTSAANQVTLLKEALPETTTPAAGQFAAFGNSLVKTFPLDRTAYLLNSTGTEFIRTDHAVINAFDAYLLADVATTARTPSLRISGEITGFSTPAPVTGTFKLSSAKGKLVIQVHQSQCIRIYSISGQIMKSMYAETGDHTLLLPEGIYLVQGEYELLKGLVE